MEKYVYRGKLERVVDGDTIDALIDVGFDIWIKKRIRYKGIDTWESRTKNLEEKEKGLAAKAYVKDLLENSDISNLLLLTPPEKERKISILILALLLAILILLISTFSLMQ